MKIELRRTIFIQIEGQTYSIPDGAKGEWDSELDGYAFPQQQVRGPDLRTVFHPDEIDNPVGNFSPGVTFKEINSV